MNNQDVPNEINWENFIAFYLKTQWMHSVLLPGYPSFSNVKQEEWQDPKCWGVAGEKKIGALELIYEEGWWDFMEWKLTDGSQYFCFLFFFSFPTITPPSATSGICILYQHTGWSSLGDLLASYVNSTRVANTMMAFYISNLQTHSCGYCEWWVVVGFFFFF